MKNICKVDGCNRAAHAHKYCNRHYYRLREYGSPLGGGTYIGDKERWIQEHAQYEGDDCLPWPFSNGNAGYGEVQVDGTPMGAHRRMCFVAHGEPPTPEHHAAHSCGKKWCRNPNHLRWATPAENEMDKIIHGTQSRGEAHSTAGLTEADVITIRALRGTVVQKYLAKRFGVAVSTICRIQKGNGWAWLQVGEIAR